jgi:ArsR family transcriptional regulator
VAEGEAPETAGSAAAYRECPVMSERIQQQKADILKAVAHPVRLSIVEMLGERERCACEICDTFPCDRTTVSKHLAVLKSLGVIEDRKEGLYVYYRLRMTCLLPFLACLERVVRSGGCGCAGSLAEEAPENVVVPDR